jgi:hypothetical protein
MMVDYQSVLALGGAVLLVLRLRVGLLDCGRAVPQRLLRLDVLVLDRLAVFSGWVLAGRWTALVDVALANWTSFLQ